MLGYSRNDSAGAPGVINPCEVVEDSVGLLGQQFLSGIHLTMELDRRASPIAASKGRLEQILLNLIVNASEAMGGRGKLTIQVRERSRSEVEASVLAPAEAGRYVELRVQDDGPGIAPEVRERIFDPFFTTKNRGARQGTGLGLSTIFTLAEQEGYGIDVESAPGLGACFRIWLPVKEAARHSPTPQTGMHG
jgi:signal transduction histidine kinase